LSLQISIVSVFPELHKQFISTSLIGRAQEKGLIRTEVMSFAHFCAPKERIDAPTVGHGVGMVIKPEVVARAVMYFEEKYGAAFKVFFSPQGKVLTEGMDVRVEELYADLVISIGDYVVMGGDLPAQVFLESVLRHIPGVVGKAESVEQDSFTTAFFDYPQYALPVSWKSKDIPEVLLSGNHAVIDVWRKKEAAKKTVLERFDWFRSHVKSPEEKKLGAMYVPSHYVVLMHSQVYVKDGGVAGNTSITSMDLHDIARSCATYGIENYFVVSALADQHRIVDRFLEFWKSDEGRKYNPTRAQALERMRLVFNFSDVIHEIERKEGKSPLVLTTSARSIAHTNKIQFTDQSLVWQQERPVLLIFGTGQGLSNELIAQSDFLLPPVGGLTSYKHLSVRSAAAIVLDRWLGIWEPE